MLEVVQQTSDEIFNEKTRPFVEDLIVDLQDIYLHELHLLELHLITFHMDRQRYATLIVECIFKTNR